MARYMAVSARSSLLLILLRRMPVFESDTACRLVIHKFPDTRRFIYSTGNNADLDDDNDGVPDYIDAEPVNADNASELILPADGGYKGSAVRDGVTVE